MLKKYETGTIQVTHGSKSVIGFGTSWLTYVLPGVQMMINGQTYIVDLVNSTFELSLTENYAGIDAQDLDYLIINPIENQMIQA